MAETLSTYITVTPTKHIPSYAQALLPPGLTSSRRMFNPQQYDPSPSTRHRKPGEIEDTLATSKNFSTDKNLGGEIEPITIDLDESVEEIVHSVDEEITLE